MTHYWWVMGGTCSGKKALMGVLMRDARTRARLGMKGSVAVGWMNDGKEPETPLANIDADNILIRWQWGREHTMRRRRKRQTILLVQTPPGTVAERALRREGPDCDWTLETFIEEADRVQKLVRTLVRRFRVPCRVVNGVTMEPVL